MFLLNYLRLSIAVILFCVVNGHDKTAPVPTSYDVTLKPHMSNMIFEGEVLVGVRTIKKESEIMLNSRGLDVTTVNVNWAGLMPVVESHSVDRQRERLKIKIDNFFAGNHTIKISFKGKIEDRGVGFFASVCRSRNSNSWIAGATLQPVDARAVFPSFDLDENKTPLKLNVILNQGINVITPIPATISQLETVRNVNLDFDQVHLEQLGWALYPNDGSVTRMESENGHSGIACRKNNWTTITYDIAEQMSNYTGTELRGTQWIMMPDFPTQFASSKNIIFIREHLLENSTFTNRMDFGENLLQINEAYAQQLFGQIIRVHWWPHIWLTKGLANFISYKLTEMVYPEFVSERSIIGNVLPRVLERETVPHSMSRHAHSKQEVLSMYDQDLFDKGGLIMRMIEEQIGENSFKRAIKDFVNKTIGSGTANPTHFWDSLQENSLDFPQGKTVEEVFNVWINSSGFPVVNARREKDYIYITQEKMQKENSKTTPGYWWIPITVTSQSLRSPRKFWLRPRGPLRVNLALNDDWYMINEMSKGFYRVNYDLENWKNLSNAITNKELKGMVRARLLDDSLALAESDRLHYSIALEFTKHLAREYDGCPHFLPWSASIRHLLTIRTLIKTSDKSHFDEYLSNLVELYIFGESRSAQVEILNSTSETFRSKVNETVMMMMLTKLSQVKDLCRSNRYCYDIIKYFTTASVNYSDTSNSMFDVIHCFNVEKDSSEKTLDNMINLYKQYESATSEMKIMKSLSCLKNTRQKHRLLDMLVDETETFKRQDFVHIIKGMSYSEENTNDILDWIITNKLKFYKYASGDMSMMSEILLALSQTIYDDNKRTNIKEIIATFENNNEMSRQLDGQQIHRALFRIEKNIHRRKKHSDEIVSWLKDRDHVDSFAAGASNDANIALLTTFCLMFIISIYITV